MARAVPTPAQVRQLYREQMNRDALEAARREKEDREYNAGLANAVSEADIADALYAEFRHVALKGESPHITLEVDDVVRRAMDVARARLGAEPSMPRGLDLHPIVRSVHMPGWVYDDGAYGWTGTLNYSPSQQCCVVM